MSDSGMVSGESRRVVMVKKLLLSGEPCQKCAQVEEMLQRRGVWDAIDSVLWADESDENSEGMVLAREHEVKLAPFFLITERGKTRVETSALKVAKLLAAEQTPAAQPPQTKLDASSVQLAADALAQATPQKVLDWTLERLGRRAALAFSGAEDVALIHMASVLGRPFSVFSLDTGRLHPETYRFIDKVRSHYGIEIHLVSPDFDSVEKLVRKKGLFSFYEDGHSECCGVRKVEPLRRVLGGFDGWVTGQRRDQSPTRAEVPHLVWDANHGNGMVKANPLAGWTLEMVWKYIRANDVPYNELHEQGFVSIGCEPCTRAPRPGEHERAGRWWWEESTQRECGLHK